MKEVPRTAIRCPFPRQHQVINCLFLVVGLPGRFVLFPVQTSWVASPGFHGFAYLLQDSPSSLP